ncbi:tetratricopeptide repeat protein [Candidatus Laterigemmans baculatus]|uniref:tetratricopeptide repeat protein n=1 Tax=Candidatus Laterigemmans baculatus TaxID=2770505 RepID=UPI0013DA5BE3|nr:tetratricopeptide repeat protein [Candidatus Laterigemmans baculatus]
MRKARAVEEAAGAGAKPGESSPPPSKAYARWAWNLPLLFASFAGLVMGALLLVVLYQWQSARVGDQFLQLAEAARSEKKPREAAQWLNRYLSLRPEDADVRVQLAWTFDSLASEPADIEQARRHLIRAIAALESEDEREEKDALRRRLIDRLLELGGGWLVEAERQISLLNPPPGDPAALHQLARSLLGQSELGTARPPATTPPLREEDYWGWAASQPVGKVLRMAVEANPESVELAGALVAVYVDRPELFDVPGVPADRTDYIGRAASLLERLSERKDDGHAQWFVYHYGSRIGSLTETEPLAVMAALALQRLQQHAVGPEAPSEAASPAVVAEGKDSTESYAPGWDAELVLEHAARLVQAGSVGTAKDFYKGMAALPPGMLADPQAERCFLGLGQTHLQLDERQEAQEAWQKGNEQLGGESLVLLEPLATAAAVDAPLPEAQQWIDRYVETIDRIASRLARTRMLDRERTKLESRLDTARWRGEVGQARVDARKGNRSLAATRLERALAAQLGIPVAQRIGAAELLAQIYGEQNLWDLAGRVLDEAVLWAPENRELRRQAAEAWQQASTPARTIDLLRHADDGSYQVAYDYAHALFLHHSQQGASDDELEKVQAAIAEAQKRLEQAREAGQSPAEPWRLGLLQLALASGDSSEATSSPSSEVGPTAEGAGTVRQEAPATTQLIDLCLQYPKAAELQSTAVLALERQGEPLAADDAMRRLEAIPQVDRLLVLETEARLSVLRGTVDKTLEKFEAYAASHPEEQPRVVKLSAELLKSSGQRSQAVELLRSLGPEARDIETLVRLGELLLELEATSPASTAGESERLAELREVEEELRATEGEEGTHWRWLAANRLLRQAAGRSSASPLLAKAVRLQGEIVARRPRWARGIALGGRIAAIEGKPAQAVELLRRAIAEGDRDVGTVLLLVQQLNRSGEVAAAEQELARLEPLSDSFGAIAAMTVGLAVDKGQFELALDRARAAMQDQPDDPDVLLMFAQTAVLAAEAQPAEAEPLQRQAAEAVERALQATKGTEVRVWDARFRMQFHLGGAAAARQVLESMERSRLPEKVRWLALGRGYLAIGDTAAARSRLEKARQLNPTDVNVHLALAEVLEAAGETEGLLQALETASRLAPNREDVRSRLAFALAAHTAGDVPWTRISQLLDSDLAGASAKSQLRHSLLLLARGDEEQIAHAGEQLRHLLRSNEPGVSDDAARLLLSVERRRWQIAQAGPPSSEAREAFAECRRLYERLLEKDDPAPLDLYGYGELLVRGGAVSEAARVADRLATLAPSSREALDLRLRIVKQREQESQLAPLVNDWLATPGNANSPAAKAAAGQVLSNLGSHALAVDLLAEAYEAEPASEFSPFVTVLFQSGDARRAAEVCMAHFRKHRSPEPVALLADVVVKAGDLDLLTPDVEHVLADGATAFPQSVRVLEAIGTLRLIQQQFAEAVDCYVQAEKLDPNSALTLNNLAIALVEIPGRQDEGLVRIQRAIELYGRYPELLDTLGFVQLHCQQFAEAEATLREAFAMSNDPRHQFHLLLALHAQKKTTEAKQFWSQLDLSQLDAANLTPSERKQLDDLRKQFGPPPSVEVGTREGDRRWR